LLLASAGTGKTTTITAKIAYMVEKENIDPSQVLHHQHDLIPQGLALHRVLEQLAVLILPAYLHGEQGLRLN
jgi:hypothetical protein